MKIDLRFLDISLELMILEEYLDILDSQLADLIKRERDKIWRDVDPSLKDDEEAALFRQHYLDEGISLRFLTAAALVGTWAEYEAGVTRLAGYLAQARGLKIQITHLKGAFLEAAQRYFDEALRFPLHASGTDWDRLKDLGTVRHALAHANGRLDDIELGKRRRIEELAKRDGNLIVREGYLIVSRKYTRDALGYVKTLLEDLSSRVQTEITSTH